MSSVSQMYFSKIIEEITLEDIQKLIDDRITEDYTLDYKEIPKSPKFDRCAKVISSFLNTKGGLLVIGVSEYKKKYPKEITWGAFTKETLVRNLYRKVDPWIDEIEIQVIENPEDENERIFVIDVPKSINPPHMANGTYYYRNVFESIPMTHSQVRGVFTESHLEKEKIIDRVIKPIYLSIFEILEKKESIAVYYGDSGYSGVLSNERHLYDQISSELRDQIDNFFKIVDLRNHTRRELRYHYQDSMKLSIVEFLGDAISLDEILNKVDLLNMYYDLPDGLRRSRKNPILYDCILNNISPFYEAGENPITKFKAQIDGYRVLSRDEFVDIFIQIKRKTQESRLFPQWNELNTEIESIGNLLINKLRAY